MLRLSYRRPTNPSIDFLLLASLVACHSFDMDLSPRKRQKDPAFYGYLPDSIKGKLAMAILLALISASNLLVRSLSFVLLLSVSKILVMAVFGGEKQSDEALRI